MLAHEFSSANINSNVRIITCIKDCFRRDAFSGVFERTVVVSSWPVLQYHGHEGKGQESRKSSSEVQ